MACHLRPACAPRPPRRPSSATIDPPPHLRLPGISWAVAVLVLTACGSAPRPAVDASVTRDVPGRWIAAAPSDPASSPLPAASAAIDPGRWWTAFDDPALQAWVEAALANNPDLTGIQARLEQSRANSRLAEAGAWPGVDGSASAQRSLQRGSSGTAYQAGLSVSWEPDVFGEVGATTRAARADVQAQAALLEQARLSLVAELASNHFARRRDMQRAILAQAVLDSQEQTQRITRWRREAGLASGLDVDQGASALAQTRAGIPGLEANVQILGHALDVLAGRAPGTLPLPAPAPSSADTTATRITTKLQALPARIPAQALEARPDVRAALASCQAAAARIDAARAARWPRLSFSASTGLEMLTTGGSASLARALLASLAVPIFDGGARSAQVDARVAAWQEASAQLRSTVLTALQEVEDALVSWRAARERQQALVAGVDAAVRAATLARTRYQAGLVDLRTVLDTQRSELSLRDALLVAQTDDVQAQVRLVKALAGGWVPRSETSGTSNNMPSS